jgi:c(7)-type cytochrome triheme protein
MSACVTCHAAATGRPRPPALADATITVTSAFSHVRHAARGTLGKTCTTCHAPIVTTDDSQLPRPTAATCALVGCHDAKAAFPVTESCARCHRDPPIGTFRVWRPDARFSHAKHGDAVGNTPCVSCHPINARGEVAIAGHAACTTCHAADFGIAQPTICGACHTSTESWRKLTPDQRPADRTEFGATLDHTKHPGACASCHSLTTAAEQLRPPRGHVSCIGAGCHAVSSGPAPRLAACASCHQAGAQRIREADRATAVWSTRATFDHAAHATTRDGHAVACITCHTDLAAPNVHALPTPAKATCAPCHDGTTAFSLTGTNCTRCHATVAPTVDVRHR